MKKLPHLARALAFVSLAALVAGCKTTSSTDEVTGEHSERLPPAPPDRGAREGADADGVHRRPPRRPDAGAARRGRRNRLELAAGSDRRHRDRDPGRRAQRARRRQRGARDPLDSQRRRRAASRDRDPAVSHRRIRSGSARSASTIRRWRPKPARAGCGPRHRPDLPTRSTGRTSRTGITAAPAQRNLAAQVANPADLVQPRAETPVLAARRTTVIDKYRKGEATATQYPDANKGKISDVGQ